VNIFYVSILFFILAGVLFVLRKLLRTSLAEGSSRDIVDLVLLEATVPKFSETNPLAKASALVAENMFAAIHGLLQEDPELQEHVSFEIQASGNSGVKFYIGVPATIEEFVKSQIYAQYPMAFLKTAEDYAPKLPAGTQLEAASLHLERDHFFPIKTFRDFEVDSMSGIMSTLAELLPDESLRLQILMKPIADIWQQAGHAYVESIREGTPLADTCGLFDSLQDVFTGILHEGFQLVVDIISGLFKPADPMAQGRGSMVTSKLPVRLSPTQDLELRAIENKLANMGFLVQARVISSAPTFERVQTNLRSLLASFKQFQTAYTNSFVSSSLSDKDAVLDEYARRAFVHAPDTNFVLTADEIATIYHLPTGNVGTPNLSWLYSKRSEPPSMLPTEDCTYMGETIFRNNKVRFGLKNEDDRLRHMYLIGKSGTGKSTLLETMITQDIKNGFGVGVLDPHGETIDKVLEYIPDERMNDVVIVDPSDADCPVGINLLELSDPSQKNLMASALVAAIKQHFDYSWGPRLEYLLNYALLTLLEVPGTSMLGITRLLEDDNYLKYILHNVKDPVVLKFWNTEYKAMKGNQKLVTEAIAPIQNKVNRFLASTTIRNILGQRRSTIDIWDIMNSGKILLMNLSIGKVGQDNANLLGALLVSRIQFMALQRAKIPYDARRPFYLYVDEFQNFATGSFESILSESRKYKLGLYLTHQYTAQLPEELLKAVFGNVGTIASFALGAPDARALSNEFAPFFDEKDIISLERFHIYIKLMIDGMTSLPFSARILLPWVPETCVVPKTHNKEKVVELSRQRFGTPRDAVEGRIAKWVETRFDKGLAIAQEHKANAKNKSSVD